MPVKYINNQAKRFYTHQWKPQKKTKVIKIIEPVPKINVFRKLFLNLLQRMRKEVKSK